MAGSFLIRQIPSEDRKLKTDNQTDMRYMWLYDARCPLQVEMCLLRLYSRLLRPLIGYYYSGNIPT